MAQQTFSIREENGLFYLYEGEHKVLTKMGSELCAKSKKLADLILEDAIKNGLEWDYILSILSYQGCYCDYQNHPEILKEDLSIIKEAAYTDDFWSFDEIIGNRAMVVSNYQKWLPDLVLDFPLYRQTAFLHMVILFNSIILPYKIDYNLTMDSSPYTIDDMDDFIEELEEFCRDLGIVPSNKKRERIKIFETLVKNFYYFIDLNER